MPSTKKRRRSRNEIKEIRDRFLLDFKRQSALEMKRLHHSLKEKTEDYLRQIDIEISQFPPEVLNMTLQEVCDLSRSEILDLSVEEEEDTSADLGKEPDTTNISDPGYCTDKSSSTKSKTLSSMKGKVRIGPKSAMKKRQPKEPEKQQEPQPQQEPQQESQPQPQPQQQQLAIPTNIYSNVRKNSKPSIVEPITPKVSSNAPLSILRHPRSGETLISMTGSPILASTVFHENRIPNLMLPLHNGDIISVLPTGDLRKSLLPTLSPGTRRQLQTLKDHIEKFLSKD